MWKFYVTFYNEYGDVVATTHNQNVSGEQVIDGQGRLEACKRRGLPVNFIINTIIFLKSIKINKNKYLKKILVL